MKFSHQVTLAALFVVGGVLLAGPGVYAVDHATLTKQQDQVTALTKAYAEKQSLLSSLERQLVGTIFVLDTAKSAELRTRIDSVSAELLQLRKEKMNAEKALAALRAEAAEDVSKEERNKERLTKAVPVKKVTAKAENVEKMNPFQRRLALLRARMSGKKVVTKKATAVKKAIPVKKKVVKKAGNKTLNKVMNGEKLTPFKRALLKRQGKLETLRQLEQAENMPRVNQARLVKNNVVFRLEDERHLRDGLRVFEALEAVSTRELERSGVLGDKLKGRTGVERVGRDGVRRFNAGGREGQSEEQAEAGLREAANQGKGAAANGVTGVGDAGTGEDLDVGDFVVPVQYSATEAEDVLIDTVQSFLGDDSGHADNPQGGPSDRLSRCNDISGGCDEGERLPIVVVGLNVGSGQLSLSRFFTNCDGRNQDCGPDAPVDEDINDLREDNCDERNDANCGNNDGERTADRETIQALQGIRQSTNPFVGARGGIFSFAIPNGQGYDFYVMSGSHSADREDVGSNVDDNNVEDIEVEENA